VNVGEKLLVEVVDEVDQVVVTIWREE